mmetsp:Transcript_22165/g.53703  ORF Transcript_22165/g.53703 Transcript_22165/m.53703 type:complete len:200 (+) Transcript_22165:1342-1941(+)
MGVASILERELRLVNPRDHRTLLTQLLREPTRDGRIVTSAQTVRPRREPLPQSQRSSAILFHARLHLVVLIRRRDDGRERVILRRGPEHGRAADVDIFDALFERRALRHRGLERVQVEHGHVDLADAVGLHVLLVLGIPAHAEEAAVHLRMERLDAPVETLGTAGVVANVDAGEGCVAELLGRPAGGEQFDVFGVEVGA